MSVHATHTPITVVGGGVVGAAVTLALARRGRAVTLLEAEPELGLAASGTNSGILHTGFDSTPGELETELIRRAVPLRDEIIETLGLPVLRCGARMAGAPAEVAENAARNGVETRWDGADLLIPGECVTDPVLFTLALAAAAVELGAEIRTGVRLSAPPSGDGIVINCAGLHADGVARLFGDHSFTIYPRKGEFVVWPAVPLAEILLPVPTKRTKGILIFPTLDGDAVCGPTAVDGTDKDDWTVRRDAAVELAGRAADRLPALASPAGFAYAGLRPAGADGANYIIHRSAANRRLFNVAAIRSTGLSAACGIADYVCDEVLELPGDRLRPLPAVSLTALDTPWWQRTAAHRVTA